MTHQVQNNVLEEKCVCVCVPVVTRGYLYELSRGVKM